MPHTHVQCGGRRGFGGVARWGSIGAVAAEGPRALRARHAGLPWRGFHGRLLHQPKILAAWVLAHRLSGVRGWRAGACGGGCIGGVRGAVHTRHIMSKSIQSVGFFPGMPQIVRSKMAADYRQYFLKS